ncbi:MAG: hypothetical protein J7647_15870 [Cyanobacteria bacterium SBLK]|nr:hypothetical protein [Cyanobacteria bacterium SBLK]
MLQKFTVYEVVALKILRSRIKIQPKQKRSHRRKYLGDRLNAGMKLKFVFSLSSS